MVWTSILSPLVFFVQRVSFCETLDSVSEYRLELILKVCFFPSVQWEEKEAEYSRDFLDLRILKR